MRDKYGIVKAFLFIGYVAGNESLYKTLQDQGYIVILKPTLEYRKENHIKTKGNVDAELVLHALIEFPKYDKAIIVSGDGDFHCLLEYLINNNKLLKLIIPNRNKFSALLRNFRDYFVYTDKLQKKVGKKKRGSNLRTEP